MAYYIHAHDACQIKANRQIGKSSNASALGLAPFVGKPPTLALCLALAVCCCSAGAGLMPGLGLGGRRGGGAEMLRPETHKETRYRYCYSVTVLQSRLDTLAWTHRRIESCRVVALDPPRVAQLRSCCDLFISSTVLYSLTPRFLN